MAEGVKFCGKKRELKGFHKEIITTAAISLTTELTVNSIFELQFYLHTDVIITAVVSTILNH